MEPLLLVCEGCGVKIRVADPERGRSRACPRCASPLGPAVARALKGMTGPVLAATWHDPAAIAAESQQIGDRFAPTTSPSRWRSWGIAAAALILGGSSLVHLFLAPDFRTVEATFSVPAFVPGSPSSACEASQPPVVSVEVAKRADPTRPTATIGPVGDSPTGVGEGPGEDSATDALADLVLAPAEPIALREESGSTTPPVAAWSDNPAPPPVTDQVRRPEPPAFPTPAVPPSSELRRLKVRDGKGKAIVAREHGTHEDRMAVVLPDGMIGWPINQIFTDEPFVPTTMDELERDLSAGEYAAFRVIRTEHYLVFFQCSSRFARDSADLLEELHGKLTAALVKQNLPVTPAEFPLVAVIFQDEADFRANRPVAPEVQAYFEILSNRIFFFEKGRRDSTSPEVSALRKPQTVVHEGTHQLLHNIGIQQRMSPWPIWLVEGLAEYCSPPKPTKNGGTDWAGLGQINVMHLTTIRDLEDPMSAVVRGGPKAPAGRRKGQSLVEYLVTRSDLTPTDYALSWGLAHYLATKRTDLFVAYIRKLNSLKPFETRMPADQLADFRAVFGKDMGKLDLQVAKHLDRLEIPRSLALPYYAVLLEQSVALNSVQRMAMVSQSPSMIRQWVESAQAANFGPVYWEYQPFPTRTRAMLAVDGWMHMGR